MLVGSPSGRVVVLVLVVHRLDVLFHVLGIACDVLDCLLQV